MWLPNLSMYFLAVIWPWKFNNGTNKKYCVRTLLPKRSQNLPCVWLLEPDILDCYLPWVFSKCTLPDVRSSMKDDSSDHKARFKLSNVHVLWLWHYHLHIWAVLSVIRYSAIATMQWMLDLWSSHWTGFVERWSSVFSLLSPVVQYLCNFWSSSSQWVLV